MSEDVPLFNLPQHKKVLKGFIDSLSGIYRVTFTKVRNQRTLSQNAYMHGVVFPHIAKGLSDAWGERVSSDQAKAIMKDMFLRRPAVNENGEVRSVEVWFTPSSADLNVSECCEFIEKVIEFGRDKLNVTVPPASDYHEPPSRNVQERAA